MKVKEVDLSELFVDSFEEKIRINGKEIIFILRPLNLGDYLEAFDKEGIADMMEILKRCIIEPKLSEKDLKNMKVGIATRLFSSIINKSFLELEIEKDFGKL